MINLKKPAYLISCVFLLILASCSDARQQAEQHTRLTEPRLMPLEESEWNQTQAQLLTPLKRHFKDGLVINVFTTLARNPELFGSWFPFAVHVMQESVIPAREREILILRIGWLCQSEYEFGQHTLMGKQVGLNDEEILRIIKGANAPGWRAFDAALIRACDELHGDAFITDETWQVLSTRYDEKQLLEVVFTVGQYNLVSMVLNSCGVQREPGVPGFPEGAWE